MKKTLILIAALFAFVAVNAQENSSQFSIEVNDGLKMSFDYPALSVVKNDINVFRSNSVGLNFGWKTSNSMIWIGGQLDDWNAPTAMYDEDIMAITIPVGVREYVNISDKLNVYFGIHVGAYFQKNKLTYLTNKYNYNRWGFDAGWDLGMTVDITDNTYFGLSTMVGYNSMSKKVDVPTGLVANDLTRILNASFQIIVGARF